MSEPLITITIDPVNKTMEVETEGFKGDGCKAIHEAFSKMGKVEKEVIKQEFYDKSKPATANLSLRR